MLNYVQDKLNAKQWKSFLQALRESKLEAVADLVEQAMNDCSTSLVSVSSGKEHCSLSTKYSLIHPVLLSFVLHPYVYAVSHCH